MSSAPANLPTPDGQLAGPLLERVLARLGFADHPEPSFEKLCAIYSAWCQRVPFDNVRKLIHLRSGDGGPLPGHTPAEFFEAWLKHGAGGTCWPGANAFHALLSSLGFRVDRVIGTMLVAPNLPPNHGSVRVAFGEKHYLVDASIIHGEPLRLDRTSETRVVHPSWGVRGERRDGRWHVWWRPLHRVDGFECRLESFGASQASFNECYEQTRRWSPFNFEVTARLNRDDRVVGVAYGREISLEGDGSVRNAPASHAVRTRVLVEQLGMSEELVSQLPEDIPTPPPPWSRTAQSQLQSGN